MNFIGFESPLENYSLANVLGSDLGLFVANSDYQIPCMFNSISITSETQIPNEPVDTNQYVSDTLIRKPVTISLELFIYEHNINEFLRLIELGTSADGFYFINRTKRSYDNLYITSMSHQYNGEKFGGFDCSLELQEVIKVSAVKSTKTVKLATPKMVDQGATIPTPVPPEQVDNRSLAMKMLNSLGFMK